MITTIIPYLLMANVSDISSTHGPEYIYSLDIHLHSEGPNNNELYPGVNMTNELKCRQKGADVLGCTFRHLAFDFYHLNSTTGEITRDKSSHHGHAMRRHAGHEHSGPMRGSRFDVKFNENGVESLVLPESATGNERLYLFKSMANLLNVGTDVFRHLTTTNSEETVNFLTGKCTGEVEVTYGPDESLENNEINNYYLDLVDPLPSLLHNKLNVDKRMNLNECTSSLKFFNFQLLVNHNAKDSTLKLLKLSDNMKMTKENFMSEFLLTIESTKDGTPFIMSEVTKLHLTDIKPAVDELPEIANPSTVSVDDEI